MITQLLAIPGGWYPRFSPNGQRVCFGFGKFGWAPVKAGADPVWVTTPGFQGGWLNDDEILVLVEEPYKALAYHVGTGQTRVVKDPFRASTFEASAGNQWGGALADGKTSPLFWNGNQVATRHLGARVWHDHMVSTKPPDDNWDAKRWILEHWHGGKPVAEFLPTVGMTNEQRIGVDGWVGFGYFGRCHVVDPANFTNAGVRDISVMPQGSGEGVAYVFRVKGALWAVTGCELQDNKFMALRPLGEKKVIKVPAPGIKPEAFEAAGDLLVVAGESDKGFLKVFAVPQSEPRVEIVAPPRPPQPEPAANPKGTITSYEPRTLAVGEECTAKWQKAPTSGVITKVYWWWRKDGTPDDAWVNATPNGNKPSDDDHHYTWNEAGDYFIEAEFVGVEGTTPDRTSKARRVTVTTGDTPKPPDPPVDPPVEPPVDPPTTPARKGLVRGNVYQFADDTGGWLPWGTSLFWALYGYAHERQRVEEHLKWIREQGADFVRVICTGLRMGTNERSISPKNPIFQSSISGLLDLAQAHGLRVQLTIFGAVYDAPSSSDRKAAIDKVCAAIAGREHAVWLIEIANEGWTNGFEGDAGASELKNLAARVRGKVKNLVATTCPKAADDITPEMIKVYYANPASATVQTLHFSRSTKAPDGIWRPTRKPWRESHFSVEGCCTLVQNNEPRGPESSVTETNDPIVLAMDAALSWQCGVGSYCLHTGAGIYGVKDANRNRPANIWETQNIGAICQGLRTVQRLLPPNLPNWKKHQSRSSGHPFTFVDVPEEQFTCGYAATEGNRIVFPVGGVVRATAFSLKEGTCSGAVYHPVTGQVLESFTKQFQTSPAQPGVLAIATRK